MHRTDSPVSAKVAAPNEAPTERLLRIPAVLDLVSLKRTAWLDLVKNGEAPASVKIGRATFWVHSEVQDFIASRIRQSRGGH